MKKTASIIQFSMINLRRIIIQPMINCSGIYGGINFILLLLIVMSLCFGSLAVAHAATVKASSISAFNSAISNANPGDTIILTDGRYDSSSTTISFSANGTQGNEVVITAETPGGVIFTGPKTFADVSGSYQIIHGFHFKDIATDGNWNTLVMRVDNASNNRVTNCKFENIGQGGGSTLVGVWYNSPNNRFDHNTWDGNDGVGIETPLTAYNDRRNSTHTTIDHNVFKNHAQDDASEALRLGRGATSALVQAQMTIEYNLFEEWHGDPETFSVKSSGNTIRYNVVKNCDGGIKLRQGDSNILEGNYYILEDNRSWDNYPKAVGIKIKGSDHEVRNNYIYRGRIGISLESAPLLSYRGNVTSQPADSNPYYLTDANATWSNDQYNGKYVWITSGGGEEKAYYIEDTDASNKRLYCKVRKGKENANLRSDGVTSGSTYTINVGDPEVRNVLLENNTIINNQRNGIQIAATSKNNIVKSNLINTNRDSGVYFGFNESSGADTTYQNNLFHSMGNMKAWGGSGTQPAGIVEGDPMLNFDGKIFRLQGSSSNAINKGTPDSNITVDIEGQERNLPPDIGADEYSIQAVVRAMITEGIGSAGVQWPNSTLVDVDINPPSGLRIIE